MNVYGTPLGMFEEDFQQNTLEDPRTELYAYIEGALKQLEAAATKHLSWSAIGLKPNRIDLEVAVSKAQLTMAYCEHKLRTNQVGEVDE